jgi:type IV pilus assembly protein PilY1
MGDIINSSAVYVSNEDYGYADKVSALTKTEKTSYKTFNASTDKSSRTKMVYVGANDGMLHGFDAGTLVEKFAVVPSAVYPKLNLLTSTDYAHEYYVDGSPVVGDAYINSSWKTVLLGSTGAGGKSVFALDITDPAHFAAGKLMWQFDTSNTTYANDIGYSIPHPSIVRLHNGKFVALIANGYNSTNGHAVLFIVDITDGSVIKAIDTGVDSDNGLSSPTPADKDGDRITDYVYAGDLKGNLWKFDLSSETVANWTASKLFTACSADTCSDSNRQPITSMPEAMRHPKGGIMVLFGTGSYFSTSDNAAARIEAIYGVRDYGSTELTRADLLKQKILAEADDTRIVSNTEVDYSTKKGWYLPLVYPDTSTTATGERVVNDVVLSSSKLIVTTLIPSAASSCDPGGNSWLMELEPINGARLNYVVLDINNDGALNDSDNKSYTETDSETGVTKTNTNTPVSGKKYSGLITTPTILDVDKSLCTDDCDTTEDEIKYITNSSGQILRVIEKNNSTNYGRQSWRQIR